MDASKSVAVLPVVTTAAVGMLDDQIMEAKKNLRAFPSYKNAVLLQSLQRKRNEIVNKLRANIKLAYSAGKDIEFVEYTLLEVA